MLDLARELRRTCRRLSLITLYVGGAPFVIAFDAHHIALRCLCGFDGTVATYCAFGCCLLECLCMLLFHPFGRAFVVGGGGVLAPQASQLINITDVAVPDEQRSFHIDLVVKPGFLNALVLVAQALAVLVFSICLVCKACLDTAVNMMVLAPWCFTYSVLACTYAFLTW